MTLPCECGLDRPLRPFGLGQSDASRAMLTRGLSGPQGERLACVLNLTGFSLVGA
jgi:hypothetical protein